MAYDWHSSQFRALLLRKHELPHALLICGAKGIGKLAFAHDLARALLCEQPGRSGEACGKCVACSWLRQDTHPDYRQLELGRFDDTTEGGQGSENKSQISVGQVREITPFINVSSHRGGSKVVLIHPAEALNLNAANALLKCLEEPPPGTYFLLVAHRWHQLLATLRSRCQRVMLPTPDQESARRWLEQRKTSNAAVALAQAGGGPLSAVEFDDDYWRQRDMLLGALTKPDFGAMRLAEKLGECIPAFVVGTLQKWSFDLAWYKVTGKVRYNPDHAEGVAAAATQVNLLDAMRFQRRMVALQRIVTHPLNARLFFEQVLLDYANMLRSAAAAA